MKDKHGGNVWEAAKALGCGVNDIIDFSASINPRGLSKDAVKAIKGSIPLLRHYPEPESLDITECIACYYGLRPENILPANGSTELIYLIPLALRPKSALIIGPAFSEYRASLKRGAASIESLVCREKDGFGLDIKRLSGLLKRRYSLLYLANPSNPAGVAIQRQKVIDISCMCRAHDTTMVVDEAFADFSEEVSVMKEAQEGGNIIVLRSLTKFFCLAGLRLGFMVAHQRTIRRFKETMPPWSVNTMASKAGASSLCDAGHMKRTLEEIKREREFLGKGISCISGLKPFPSSANFIMARIDKKGIGSVMLKKMLLEKRILIRPLAGFQGLGDRYFRVSVRKRQDNKLLIQALKGIFGG
jgi:threonine-phosphate decarboxylase